MLENSYLIGLDISIKISVGIGIIFLIAIFIYYILYEENNIGTFFGVLLISLGVCISSFLLIYPLYNLILQDFLNLEFYHNEISQGTLALRITSLLLGFNFLKSLYNFIENKIKETQEKLTASYPELVEIVSFIKDDFINFIIVTQNLIYAAIVLLLWIFIFLSKSLFELRIVSWGLFFIIDDWAIISDNLIALKGRILKWHRLRILFFNGLLSTLIISACFRQLDNLLFSIIITVILFILVLFNGIFFFPTDKKSKTN